MNVVTATRPRCLAVGAGVTAALWGAAAVLVRWVAAGQPATAEDALVRLCGAALVASLGWAWLQAIAGVADAWRGSVSRTHPGAVRRLALIACGAAVAGALTVPASPAAPGTAAAPDGPRPHVLAGLPMPDRAVGPAHRPERTVVARAGDSLWALARAELGATATDRQVAERWRAVYRRNRAVIGPDPDLIHPGQVLHLPDPPKEQR